MKFTRIESIVLYTSSALFSLLIFFIFYRVFLIAWKRLLLRIRPQSLDPPDTRQDRRVRELLQRPSLRNLLASRAEFVQERERRQNAIALPVEAVVSQTPGGRSNKENISENNNSAISTDNNIQSPGEYSVTNNTLSPPPYDTLSIYSGPPPSYHSDDNT